MDAPRRTNDAPDLGRVELVIPSEAAYRALYPRRFCEEVLRWADDRPLVPTLGEFLARRRERMADPTCIERIINLRDEPLGTITAFEVDRLARDCELGVVLVDRERWGQGIGARAMTMFFRLLRGHGLRVVNLETFADNHRAQAAFCKVGFRSTRRYMDHAIGREVIVMTRRLETRG